MEAIDIHEHLRSHCLPLYVPNNLRAFRDGVNDGGVRFLGTGTLLEVEGMRFVVSAQHVLEDALRTHLLYPIDKERMTNFNGRRVRFNREVVPPHYDVGILEVDGFQPLDLYRFARLEDTTAYQEPTPPGLIHKACGYPGTKQKTYGRKNNVKAKCYSFEWISVPHDVYEDTQAVHPQHHVALSFDGKMTSPEGVTSKAPNVEGMSGGPIWINTRGGHRITGIITHHWGNRNLVTGTRVEFALLQLANAFPNLRDAIERWLRPV